LSLVQLGPNALPAVPALIECLRAKPPLSRLRLEPDLMLPAFYQYEKDNQIQVHQAAVDAFGY
jgi:hypothetical protein